MHVGTSDVSAHGVACVVRATHNPASRSRVVMTRARGTRHRTRWLMVVPA
jgi:hypothetical protein